MGTKIKRFFKKIRIKRTTVLVLVFVFMSATLVRQLFELQIIQGQDYISKFESRTTKKRVIKSTVVIYMIEMEKNWQQMCWLIL